MSENLAKPHVFKSSASERGKAIDSRQVCYSVVS